MSSKPAKVISLSQVRALRDTFDALHSSEAKAVILAGASNEFRQCVAPVIRELLAAKGTPPGFQEDVIRLLERVYAAQHIAQEQTRDLLNDVTELVRRVVSSS